jgi:hypothetical protein
MGHEAQVALERCEPHRTANPSQNQRIKGLNASLKLREAGLCQTKDLIRVQEVGLDLGEEPEFAFSIQFAKDVQNFPERRIGIEHRVHKPDFFGSLIHENANALSHLRGIEESRFSSQVPIAAIAAAQRAASPGFKISHAVRIRPPTRMMGGGQTLLKGNAG